MSVSVAEYYCQQPQYHILVKLRSYYLQGISESQLLTYLKQQIKTEKVQINDYVQHPSHKEIYVPLVYLFSLSNKYANIVKYLLECRANPLLNPDSEDHTKIDNILFVCNSLYFKHISDRMNMNTVCCSVHSIQRRLAAGDWRRLKALESIGYIKPADIQEAVKSGDLLLHSLTAMKEYLMYCYNIRKDVLDKTEITQETIAKFVKVASLLIRWGCLVSKDTIELCIMYYLYEFLELPIFTINLSSYHPPVYHEKMDPLVVAMYRPLLNDRRYRKTCDVMKCQPDRDLFVKAFQMFRE